MMGIRMMVIETTNKLTLKRRVSWILRMTGRRAWKTIGSGIAIR
jgi:hypothetical protein